MKRAAPAGRRGFTLIEIIMAIVVISISFYILIAVLMSLTPRTATIEALNKKVYLAQEKAEEFLARRFSGAANVAETSFPAPFSSFKYKIDVTYVTSTDVNTAVGGPTGYRNVKVRVWGGSVDPSQTVEIVSLLTSYEAQ